MTAGVFGPAPDDGPDPLSVGHVAPFVVFLASPAAEEVNGQAFVVHGGAVALLAPPRIVEQFDAPGAFWTPDELAATVGAHFDQRGQEPLFSATEIQSLHHGG